MSCSNDQILSVGLIQTKLSSEKKNNNEEAPSKSELGPSVANNLQNQLIALFFDRLFRAKNSEKFKQLLDL